MMAMACDTASTTADSIAAAAVCIVLIGFLALIVVLTYLSDRR